MQSVDYWAGRSGGTGASTKTTPGNTFRWCYHHQWLLLGKPHDPYRVFVKSGGASIPNELDVYIDLTGSHGRYIPDNLNKYFRSIKPQILMWEISDGGTCPVLPGAVLKMVLDGLKVGWGCLGGHGRTGWLAAKIHMLLSGCSGSEAVHCIRNLYCQQAVETTEQYRDLGAAAYLTGYLRNPDKRLERLVIKATQGDDPQAIARDGTETTGDDDPTDTTDNIDCVNDCRICLETHCNFHPDFYEQRLDRFELNPECLLDRPCEDCQYLFEEDGKHSCYFHTSPQPMKLHSWCNIYVNCFDCEEMEENLTGTYRCRIAEAAEGRLNN